jgi:hypothetical protein
MHVPQSSVDMLLEFRQVVAQSGYLAVADAVSPDPGVNEKLLEATEACSRPGVDLEDVDRKRRGFHAYATDDQVDYSVHEVVCANPLPHEVRFDELSSSSYRERVAVTTRIEEFRERDIQKVHGGVGARRCDCMITKRPNGTIGKPLEQEVEECWVKAIEVQLRSCRDQ